MTERLSIEDMIREASLLPGVTPEQLSVIEQKKNSVLEEQNKRIAMVPNVSFLIGDNPLDMVFDNHRNHIQFILQVLKLNDFNFLVNTLPWVYRTYSQHGFSFDYFQIELQNFLDVYRRHLDAQTMVVIEALYSALLRWHPSLVHLVTTNPEFGSMSPVGLSAPAALFLDSLLNKTYRETLELACQVVHRSEDLKSFYLEILQPVLYQVGWLWQNDQISVAEEHLATAMVNRIMAALYSRFPLPPFTRGHAIIASSPLESHEVGGRMVADFMEMHGWNVDFIGGNTPRGELIKRIRKTRPFLVGFSVTMSYHLDEIVSLIRLLKSDPELSSVRLMVGGIPFHNNPELWKQTGADGWAVNAQGAAELANQWWDEQ